MNAAANDVLVLPTLPPPPPSTPGGAASAAGLYQPSASTPPALSTTPGPPAEVLLRTLSVLCNTPYFLMRAIVPGPAVSTLGILGAYPHNAENSGSGVFVVCPEPGTSQCGQRG